MMRVLIITQKSDQKFLALDYAIHELQLLFGKIQFMICYGYKLAIYLMMSEPLVYCLYVKNSPSIYLICYNDCSFESNNGTIFPFFKL